MTRDRVVVLCDNIEAPRIAAEETGDLGVEMCIYPWWEGLSEERIRDIAGSDRWLADIPMTGRPSLEALLYPLRAALDDSEVETYRELGLVTGLAIEEAAQSVEIGQAARDSRRSLRAGC